MGPVHDFSDEYHFITLPFLKADTTYPNTVQLKGMARMVHRALTHRCRPALKRTKT